MQPVEIMQCGRLVRLVWLNGALVRLSDLQSKPAPTATSLAIAATNAQEDSPRYEPPSSRLLMGRHRLCGRTGRP